MIDIKFALLGPLRAWRRDENLLLGSPQQQSLLVMLVLAGGRTVSNHTVVEALWPEGTATGAAATIRTYVSRLRRILDPAPPEPSGSIITTAASGYRLNHLHDTEHVDTVAFVADLLAARAARGADQLEKASRLVRTALDRWEDPPLASLPGLDSERARLTDMHREAVRLGFDVDLRLGRHADIVGELTAAVATHPYDEHLRELLMLTLYRSGRQTEALAAFREARQLLDEQLGIEPGPGLARLHSQILAADENLLPQTDIVQPQVAVRTLRPSVPAQLPPPPTTFTGRSDEINDIREALTETPHAQNVIIEALGGRGKTALALETAHQALSAFPDGQLYAELGDKNGDPASPDAVLVSFLEAFGLARSEQPARLDQKASAWRSLLHRKRVLLILDDACGPDQIRHLLPPRSRSAAIVTTTRQWMTNTDQNRLVLDDLPVHDGVALLKRIGDERVHADLASTRRLVELCGGNPLALRVLGLRLLARPSWTMGDLVEIVNDDREARTTLGTDWKLIEAPIRRVVERLPPGYARAFRRCATVSSGELTPYRAADLLGQPLRTAASILETLSDEHLVEPVDGHRYRCSPLIAAFALRHLQTSSDDAGILAPEVSLDVQVQQPDCGYK
jgi:DNA-binding SARP family transcriptional activator